MVGPTDRNPDGGHEMAGTLADLKAQLADVMADLANMPRVKAGSRWHADRVEEARWLVRAIDRMEGRDPARN
jgi:Cys-tRNA synthase (O-phospho-L-seryl-tRNA:Cys-tRNA synthase)